MNLDPRRPLAWAPALAVAVALAAPVTPASTPSPAAKNGKDALEYAFRFASAIVSDPKDMAKAQEAVVWDLVSAGAWGDATEYAGRIAGWRGGTAFADLATALAKTGRGDEARAMIAKAEEIRSTIAGWQNPRIAAHIGNAWAALGETDRAKVLTDALAVEDSPQYGGRSKATVASGLAANGAFEEASKELEGLAGAKEIDDTWWRTVGYVEMSRQSSLSREQRLKALAEARRSAEGIPTWKKAEALESIADEYRKQGMPTEAREVVSEAEAILTALPDTMPIKAPLLSNCARAWAELGRKDQARSLLATVEALAPKVQEIERPTVYANAGTSFAAMGDRGAATRLFGRALDEAALLVNARPRALAIVEVCRSMGRSGMGLDARMRMRLDGLYAGLKDPW